MGLIINGVPAPERMSEQGLVTTQTIAELLHLHDYTVSKMFGHAYVRNRLQLHSSPKLYSLQKVAEILTQTNGYKIEPKHLYELILRGEGIKIMDAAGAFRSPSSWRYWQRHGIGPRPVKVGSMYRYIRSEVEAWAKYLAANPRPKHDRGANPCADRSAPPSADPSEPERVRSRRRQSRVRGPRGGAVQSSRSRGVREPA